MKLTNIFNNVFRADLFRRTEQPAENRVDPLPFSGGGPFGLKYEARRGAGKFAKWFKSAGNNKPGSQKNQDSGPGRARRPNKVGPLLNGSVPKTVVKTRIHDPDIASKRNPRPNTVSPDSGFEFSTTGAVPAAEIKKRHRQPYTPVSIVTPDSGFEFSTTDAVPAAEIKKRDRQPYTPVSIVPPSDPVRPASGFEFSESHTIPAAEIKKRDQALPSKEKTDGPSNPVATNVPTGAPLEPANGEVPTAENRSPWQQHLKNDSAISVKDIYVIPPESGLKPDRDVNPQNKVRQPEYEPIKLPTYSGYGGLNKAEVTCNDFAREAARRLIRDGKLDTAHIPLMMVEASENEDLPDQYRAHLVQVYQDLENDPALGAKINSTCEHGWPKGKAAENLRTTLKLDPDEPVTDEHARMAQVMALLANYRQGRVGSCFAFAPASCLHADSRVVVVSHLKELLEDNRLTLSDEGVMSQVPFNGHFSRRPAQAPLLVRGDGKCLGSAVNGGGGDEYDLYDTPGMRAALQALGVPETEMEFEVSSALWMMGVQDEKNHTVTCEQVIKQIASTRDGAHDPGKLTKAALHAFCAQDSVGLLRAWEYTLAAKGTPEAAKRQTEIMVAGFVRSPSGDTRAHSLESACKASVDRLSSQTRFEKVPLRKIRGELFNQIEKQMGRFCMLFGPDVESGRLSGDGVSSRGGWLLYDRTPRDDPKKWRRIDSEEAFRDAMVGVLQDASEKAIPNIESYKRAGSSANPLANREALHALAGDLVEHVFTKEFIDLAHSTTTKGRAAANGAPFEQAYGGATTSMVENLGGKRIHTRSLSAEDTSLNKTDKDQTDATEVVRFLCEGLAKMRPQLQAKRDESHAGFRIPVANDVHGFTLLPDGMKDIWLHGATPEDWMAKNLVEPATLQFKERRLDPPLITVLRELAGKTDMEEAKFNAVYQGVANKMGRQRNLQQAYSVEAIYAALKKQYADEPEKLEYAERFLAKRFPFPAPKRIGDTNFSLDNGNPEYAGVLFNPFKGRTELHCLNGNNVPVAMMQGDWLTGWWDLYSPLPGRVA
jgi:hypothetical protein